MTHQPRLSIALRDLLLTQRVAALGTSMDDGMPFVSMVPYAIHRQRASLLLHVSGLAQHSQNMAQHPAVSMLVMQAEVAGQPVHALPRVTLPGKACFLEHGSALWQEVRQIYLDRFPEAEPMTELGDFRFVEVQLSGARQVAGFGAARSLNEDDLRQLLRSTD